MRGLILAARESFWFLPAVFGLAAIALGQGLILIDHEFARQISTTPFFAELSASGGRSILTTIASSMLTVAGTSFSITISVLATTSSTYGPRLVRNFLADRANQFVLAMFTSTFLYCLLVVRAVRTTIEDRSSFVPTLGIHVAVLLAVVDVGVLVFFIHHIATSVQITTLQKRVQQDLLRAVDRTHPAEIDTTWTRRAVAGSGPFTMVLSKKDGYVQALDLDDLLALASRHDLLLEMLAMPGDHLVEGSPIARAFSVVADRGTSRPEAAWDDIRAAYAVGTARTTTQDVRYALQQLIEIAVRGLASGTNDPYTSVSALELSRVALIPLVQRADGPTGRLDPEGTPRVTFNWPTTVQLIDEVLDSIRRYGREHPAVVRAALDLIDDLGQASSSVGVVDGLAVKARQLMHSYEDANPDPPDLNSLTARSNQVLDRLHARVAD